MDDQWQFRLSKSESVSIKEGFKRFTVILRKVCSLQISANLNNSCLLSLPILTPITSRVFVVFWSRTLLASVEYLQNKFCFKVAVCCIAAGCPSLPPREFVHHYTMEVPVNLDQVRFLRGCWITKSVSTLTEEFTFKFHRYLILSDPHLWLASVSSGLPQCDSLCISKPCGRTGANWLGDGNQRTKDAQKDPAARQFNDVTAIKYRYTCLALIDNRASLAETTELEHSICYHRH